MKQPVNKLIVRNYTDLNDLEILSYVMTVMKAGKISETNKGPQYCFHTSFKDGIEVSVHKSGINTETFYVYKEGDRLRDGKDIRK